MADRRCKGRKADGTRCRNRPLTGGEYCRPHADPDDPRALAQRENLVPGAGAGVPGEGRNLVHGARTTSPQRSPEWSPAVASSIDDLEQRVAAELRDRDGNLQPWALPSVEAVALLRVQAARVERYLASREARGTIKPTDVELASKVAERYHRGLEREALTLRSRLDGAKAAAQIDLARKWAEDD